MRCDSNDRTSVDRQREKEAAIDRAVGIARDVEAVPVPHTENAIEAGLAGWLVRTEPAAALRGFGVGFFPSATSRSLSRRKPESGM